MYDAVTIPITVVRDPDVSIAPPGANWTADTDLKLKDRIDARFKTLRVDENQLGVDDPGV